MAIPLLGDGGTGPGQNSCPKELLRFYSVGQTESEFANGFGDGWGFKFREFEKAYWPSGRR
jgi:hypothetical protein